MSITNVAIYVRVSTDRQAKKGDSIDEQLSTCKNYIDSKENMVLAGTYIDDGISGRKINRGDFEQLLDDVRLGRIDLIIFTKLDRWFRSLRHYLNTQAILEANHCDWLAVDQPYFDTTTPHGRAFVAQSMTFAELEAENDSVRIRDVFDYKYRQGEVLSGKVPLGYSIENKHLVLNQDADKVLHIFQFYAECGSLNQTISHLERDMGIIMSQDNLKKSVLKNKKYIGVFRDNDHYCPDHGVRNIRTGGYIDLLYTATDGRFDHILLITVLVFLDALIQLGNLLLHLLHCFQDRALIHNGKNITLFYLISALYHHLTDLKTGRCILILCLSKLQITGTHDRLGKISFLCLCGLRLYCYILYRLRMCHFKISHSSRACHADNCHRDDHHKLFSPSFHSFNLQYVLSVLRTS